MQPADNQSELFVRPLRKGGDSPCEIWKTHPNHPGYEFSNLGRVYSHHSGKFLKGRIERTGHIYLELVRRFPLDDRPQPPLHRLILEVFEGPCPPDKQIVCHINGNPKDNRAENLRWGTSQENSVDRHIHNGTSKGGRRSRAKRKAPLFPKIKNTIWNSLAEAIKKGENCETIQIPKTLAKAILAELNPISPP